MSPADCVVVVNLLRLQERTEPSSVRRPLRTAQLLRWQVATRFADSKSNGPRPCRCRHGERPHSRPGPADAGAKDNLVNGACRTGNGRSSKRRRSDWRGDRRGDRGRHGTARRHIGTRRIGADRNNYWTILRVDECRNRSHAALCRRPSQFGKTGAVSESGQTGAASTLPRNGGTDGGTPQRESWRDCRRRRVGRSGAGNRLPDRRRRSESRRTR